MASPESLPNLTAKVDHLVAARQDALDALQRDAAETAADLVRRQRDRKLLQGSSARAFREAARQLSRFYTDVSLTIATEKQTDNNKRRGPVDLVLSWDYDARTNDSGDWPSDEGSWKQLSATVERARDSRITGIHIKSSHEDRVVHNGDRAILTAIDALLPGADDRRGGWKERAFEPRTTYHGLREEIPYQQPQEAA